jgi:hypothetical protein
MTRQQMIDQYLKIRFPDSPQYYHDQWIARFDRGEEWNYSDFSGRRVLHKLDPNWYPADENAFKVLPPYPAI